MRDLLGPAGRATVRALAAPGTLVVLDFDGTLAPLVRDRTAARLSPGTRALLAALARARPVAVLSGRGAADLAARVEGLPLRWIVGGHGAEWPGEPWPRGLAGRVAGWRRRLGARLGGVPGIDLEDKEVSLSVHWRGARDAGAAEAAVLAAAADLPGARLVGGKRVLNVVPAGAPDKGDALARLVREARCARVLFVGDDVTDESGFARSLPVPATMVRVGASAASAAPWFLRRRADVDRLLARLVPPGGRRAPSAPEGRWAAGAEHEALGPVIAFMRTIWALEHGLNRRSREMLGRHGVTGPQRLVVRVVGRLGPIPPGALARVLHLHPASVTRLARALERRGLLVRRADPGDRRRLLLRTTPAAGRIEALDRGTIEAAIRDALASAAPGEVAAARQLVQRIADGLIGR